MIINKCVCNYCITRLFWGWGNGERERSGVGGLGIKERERRGKTCNTDIEIKTIR